MAPTPPYYIFPICSDTTDNNHSLTRMMPLLALFGEMLWYEGRGRSIFFTWLESPSGDIFSVESAMFTGEFSPELGLYSVVMKDSKSCDMTVPWQMCDELLKCCSEGSSAGCFSMPKSEI